MICPKCGKEINKDYFCESCNIEVKFYEKIKNTSNWLYNQGLQKARVRDLTGAIDFLKRSLKFNKKNIEARNLLGLVYFEIGEVVLALEQWVISKNFKEEDNRAIAYINEVQENQHKLAKYNSAIKKYNQALGYVEQRSFDLAVIQLKKVVSINGNFVKAYCLLALVYMHLGEFEKAKKVILKILSIDKNNYTALRYYDMLSEGANQLYEEDFAPVEERVKESKKLKLPSFSDNFSYIYQIAYIVIGIIIGAAVVSFLVLPSQVGSKNKTIDNLRNQQNSIVEEKDRTITVLSVEKEELEKQVQTLTAELEGYLKQDEYLQSLEYLQNAVEYYFEGDRFATAEALYQVDEEILVGTPSANIFIRLRDTVYDDVAIRYYGQGYAAYSASPPRFEEAIHYMTLSLRYAPNGKEAAKALYFRARSYQRLGDNTKAIMDFDEVLTRFPNVSPYAGYSADYKRQLTN